ncbi:MAG: NgoMIV family type II restriction endonuclease, partial [Microthrixaceae bacterium]
IRHRRGRQPHIVTVTSEPQPTRLAAICRGTGEVDAVYHVCLRALEEAVAGVGNEHQRDALAEIVSQDRLFDVTDLPLHLTV